MSRLILGFGLLMWSVICNAVPGEDWALKVTQRWNNSEWFLDFELTRTKPNTISVFESSLPWGVRTSIEVVAVYVQEGSKILKEAIYIDDSWPGSLEIAAGQTVRGKIALNYRFPELRKQNTNSPIAVCYRYRFDQLEPKSNQEAIDCLILKKKVPHKKVPSSLSDLPQKSDFKFTHGARYSPVLK